VAVAGNATVALARVAKRSGAAAAAAKPLCGALADYRSYVRVGALTGLRLASISCDKASAVRRVLRNDRSWRVRLAAAALLRLELNGKRASVAVKRALWRCAVEDRDALVAERCGSDPDPPAGAHDVTVYVVPDGKPDPRARAPFALVLPDGSMRLGVADRRGAMFEPAVPGGRLELAVPAALAR
jgi:hypothetical protein